MADGPRPTGTCWCGCGEETGYGRFFAPGTTGEQRRLSFDWSTEAWRGSLRNMGTDLEERI